MRGIGDDEPGVQRASGEHEGVRGGRELRVVLRDRRPQPVLAEVLEHRFAPARAFRQDQQKSSVTVETVENAPAGTVIQTGGNGSTPGAAPADPNAKKDDKGNTPEPEKKKKSFWRKLIPFA